MIKSLFYSFTGWFFFCHLLMAQPHPKDIALFPQENPNRSISDLSGIWEFKKDPENIGIKNQWFNGLTETRSIAGNGIIEKDNPVEVKPTFKSI